MKQTRIGGGSRSSCSGGGGGDGWNWASTSIGKGGVERETPCFPQEARDGWDKGEKSTQGKSTKSRGGGGPWRRGGAGMPRVGVSLDGQHQRGFAIWGAKALGQGV